MTVSTIATIAAGLTRALGNQNANATNNIFTNLLGGQRSARDSVSTDITAVIGLQNQIAQFRGAARDVAQADALLSTARDGAEQINSRLEQLTAIATRAAQPTTSVEERATLNTQFQTLRGQIDQIARNTRFGNESLLDGSGSTLRGAASATGQANGAIGSLTDATLFRGVNLDISTASGATIALNTLRSANQYVDSQIASISELQRGLDLAAGTLQSAIQNQEAASSTLNDADFTTQLFALTEGRSTFGFDTQSIQNVQTRRLPPSFVALLSQ